MKTYDFQQTLKELDGKPATDPVFGDDGKPTGQRESITFSKLAIQALMAKEDGLGGDKMLKRWTMAKKIQEKKVVELTAEQVVELKKCIERAYPQPLVYGQFYEFLEGPVKE